MSYRRHKMFCAIAAALGALIVVPSSAALCAGSSPPVFPSIELIHYDQTDLVHIAQLNQPVSTLTVRVFNGGKTPTDPISLSAQDRNGLLKPDQQISVPRLMPDDSLKLTLKFHVIPPAIPFPTEQVIAWNAGYSDHCGVDLYITMDWQGSAGQTPPPGSHLEVGAYLGMGNSTAAQEGPDTPVCDATQCVSIRDLIRYVHWRLACKVVGFSFFAGHSQNIRLDAFGKGRTAADAPPLDYKTTTKMTLASSSKVITALAAIKVLAKNHIHLDAAIGTHLPSGWAVDPAIKSITFRELLAQKSGIKDYGNSRNDYAHVKAFFTQTVDTTQHIHCKNAAVSDPANPINRDGIPCYSNYNTAIFRILLPTIEGTPDDAAALADKYVALVQENVFEPIGLHNVLCKPPTPDDAARGYKFPGASGHGTDWDDLTLQCGAVGWYLSVHGLSKILDSLNSADGKILAPEQFNDMQSTHLGWDLTRSDDNDRGGTVHTGYRLLLKDGRAKGPDASNPTALSTAIAIIGGPPISPGDLSAPSVIAALFVNSDITGVDLIADPKASNVLLEAWAVALKKKP